MKKFFSKVNKEELLACVIEKPQINNYRQDLSPVNEFLQVSARKFEKEITVAPHKHILNKRKIDRTQEAWIIVSGKVEFELFDVDDKLLTKSTLCSGDCLVLYKGGHSLRVIEKNTIMYEIKNGPYQGIENDKVNI